MVRRKAGVPVVGLLMVLVGTAHAVDTVAPAIEQAVPIQKGGAAVLPPVVRERTEYYEVRGNREYDLQCELKDKGCDWTDGKTYDSMTTWEFAWEYDYVRTPASCSVDAFRVTVNIVFRYPKWMRDDAAPQALIEKWDAYMEALVDHETGHRDMALLTAHALIRDVNALSPAVDCAELDRAIKQVCRRNIEQLQEDTESYDAGTMHGESQGAVLE